MLNYITINCTNDDALESQRLEASLKEVFKYTQKVNAHVIFNFKSPVDAIGLYKYVIFIDIPYEKGNYFRSRNKVYLNSLVVAVRSYEDNSVVSLDSNSIRNEKGSWSYAESISYEKRVLRKFVHENIQGIKHFDVAVFHQFSSTQCPTKGGIGNIIYNSDILWYDVISQAVEETSSNDGKKTNCIVYSSTPQKIDCSEFVSQFIEICEAKTKQGILTVKKINAISEAQSNQKVEKACELAGNKLCIITGKAGTGKSLVLMKIMYRKIKKDEEKRNHRCRFLTYNNMLVMDIKQTIRNMGEFTQSNAYVSTLHKYFLDIYMRSPVRVLHMDGTQIKNLFAKCHYRVSSMVVCMYDYRDRIASENVEAPKVLDYYYKAGQISSENYKECEQFCNYLYNKERYINFDTLDKQAKEYEENKRKMFDEHYAQREFLNGYNKILEDLYFMFHNKEEFVKKYGLSITYSEAELRNSAEFRQKYEQLYDDFMKEARKKFVEENNLVNEEIISAFFEQESKILEELAEKKRLQNEDVEATFKEKVKKVLDKLNWSDMILVDEAQDCSPYEKALLLEMHGSDNIVIATGGKDQLIRTSVETTWNNIFGMALDSEHVRLDYVHRQKANIVNFNNKFAEAFHFNTSLKASESTRNQGKIIIDARTGLPQLALPSDIIERLYLSGKDHGCSDYENMMFLIPGGEYIQHVKSDNPGIDVNIDRNDTITFQTSSTERSLAIKFPDYLKILDGTINSKRELLNRVGYDSVRCLLYESCRGLEAWNVMCLDLDDFFYDRYYSEDAEVYATDSAGLFQDTSTIETYKERFAALWVFMAITRAMDTLYIKLSSSSSNFSQTLLEIGRSIPGVEILEGSYVPQAQPLVQPVVDLPF